MPTLTRQMLAPLSLPRAHRSTDIDWNRVEDYIVRETEVGFTVVPEYQRGIVWTEAQRIAYVEHLLLGGETAREVTTVCVGRSDEDYVYSKNGSISLRYYSLLDGLQRVTAARAFMRDEFPVLTEIHPDGFRWSQIDRSARSHNFVFKWRMVVVPKETDVLKLYLRMNSGGTQHTPEELARVRAMLAAKEAAEAK